jgi:general L-amino acid transport system substrate-binding protein
MHESIPGGGGTISAQIPDLNHSHPPAANHLPVANTLARTLLLFLLACVSLSAHAAATLDHIRQNKILRCGINQETPEYSTSDDHGARQAFDADICKAIAVAILGPDARTAITAYPDDVTSMAGLTSGKVDLLPTLTLDLKHSTVPGIAFSPPLLYDGVGFLVPIAANLARATGLSDRKICFVAETEVEVALRAWFLQQHLKFLPFPFQEEGEMEAAFVTGNCIALAGDLTRLANTRVAFGPLAARYALLPDQISRDPLAAAFRSGDPAFEQIVRWTIEVVLQAEASGLTQHNIILSSRSLSSHSQADGPTPSPDPIVQILTGQTHEIGPRLGLDNQWAAHVIAAVGNYGEIYDRDLGDQSPLKLARALNRLDTQGGLMVPLPLK